jgi:hypothetical protein
MISRSRIDGALGWKDLLGLGNSILKSFNPNFLKDYF